MIGFTGTQDGMAFHQKWALDVVLHGISDDTFGMGCCVGADVEAAYIATGLGLLVKGYPPIDQSKMGFPFCDSWHEPGEYLERNHWIVDDSSVLIACPKTPTEELRSGTWATVRYARKKGVPVIILEP